MFYNILSILFKTTFGNIIFFYIYTRRITAIIFWYLQPAYNVFFFSFFFTINAKERTSPVFELERKNKILSDLSKNRRIRVAHTVPLREKVRTQHSITDLPIFCTPLQLNQIHTVYSRRNIHPCLSIISLKAIYLRSIFFVCLFRSITLFDSLLSFSSLSQGR